MEGPALKSTSWQEWEPDPWLDGNQLGSWHKIQVSLNQIGWCVTLALSIALS